MKALAITAPGQTAFIDKPEPRPAAGEVLLRIQRLGLCGSDLNTFRGLNPLVNYPRVPGHEIAAVVAAVAEGVPDTIQPGLEVTCYPYTNCGRCTACRSGRPNACQHNQTLGIQRDGALTEFVALPWPKLLAAPKLSLRELALVEPLSVGFHAVERGRVSERDTVVVLGSGMIGLGAIAGAARRRGARVIAVDVDDAKLALARKAGAREVVNSRTESLTERLRALTDGDGPNVAIEAVGLPATFVAAVEAVCFGGRVVYIGYAKAPVEYQTKQFILKELDIYGSRNATRENFDQVIGVLQAGGYPVAETITRTVPFEQAGAALAEWSAAPARVTKIQVAVTTTEAASA